LTRSVIIDGNHVVHRYWHKPILVGGRPLRTRGGKPSGVVHGVLSSIVSVIDLLKPDFTYIVWDRKSRYRRRLLAQYREKLERDQHTLLAETPRMYKESRYKDRSNADHLAFQEELLPQMQDLQYIMSHIGIRSLCVNEVEGDDLIGISADILSSHGEVVIVSNDNDLYQLLNDTTQMYDPIKKVFYGAADFTKDYGIPPLDWPEVKALMGDEHDDIPGVPKIGEKRALDLIREHQDLPAVIEACKQAPKKAWMTPIPEYERQIQLAYEMSFILSSVGELDQDQQTEFLDQWKAPATVDWDEIRQFCESYELNKVYAELRKLLITRADEAALVKCSTLDEVFAYWGDCRRCPLHENRIHIVKYGGSPKAKIALCGEGPGSSENIRGEPFIGKAGKFLEEHCLKPNGLARVDLHILNTVCCRPTDENGDNRAPDKDEMAACHPRLVAQIRVVDPTVVVLIGDKALKAFFPESGKISQERGADTPMTHPDFPGVKFVAVFHPSYLMRLRPNHSHRIKSATDWKYIKRLADDLAA
jgi:uracil-DNA glycosylase family 4